MKIIEQYGPTRPVDFFGVTLHVPETLRFVAADKDGNVYAYESQPQYINTGWYGSNCASQWVAEVDLENEAWRSAIVEIPA